MARGKVFLGGLGALTPLVLNLLVLDLDSLWPKVTLLAVVGYLVRVVSLFYLGGLVAWMHKDETDAVKLFELGMAAPALITVFLNGQAIKQQHGSLSDLLVPSVHAADAATVRSPFSLKSVRPSESATAQFLRGLTGSPAPTGGNLPPHTVVFASSSADQPADTSNGRSLFTDELLQALRRPQGEPFRLPELGTYLQQSVTERTRGAGTPVVEMDWDNTSGVFFPSRGRMFVISIGISAPPGWPDATLRSAENNANSFAQFMNQRGANVTRLTGQYATRAAILANSDAVGGSANSTDTFVFYFSGPAIRGDDGFARLIVGDSRPSSRSSVIGLDELKTMVAGFSTRQNILVFDSFLLRGDLSR